MPPPTSARSHYRRLQRLKALTVASVRRAWGRMGTTDAWEQQYRDEVGPQVNALVVAAQIAATRDSDIYTAAVLNELDFGPPTEPGVVIPDSLAGYTGDGREVTTLLATSVGRARAVAATTDSPEAGLLSGQAFIDMVTESLIADAARAAEQVAMAQRPWVDGFVRMINPPCCSRCAVLSGKFYLFNEGFLRHPRCDCYHLPAPSDPDKVRDLIAINSPDRYFESLTEAEQNKIFTKAGADAIREGADISRVVNARRGMSKSQDTGRLKRVRLAGRDVYVTTEATTRRGRRAGQTAGVRLMPESILEIAGDDRAEVIRLLRVHGYLP